MSATTLNQQASLSLAKLAISGAIAGLPVALMIRFGWTKGAVLEYD